MANVLAVVAHPDDEALGCGGTLAKHAEQGDEITLLVMTDGVSARQNNSGGSASHQRSDALRKSCDILGINRIIPCDFPDNQMDSFDLLTITQTIEKYCLSLAPEIIYTHSLVDLNIDHRLTAQAVLTAFRPIPGSDVTSIFAFEVLSSTEWQFGGEQYKPNWFVDITHFFTKKIKALSCYQDEMRSYPHPRSFEGVEILAQYRGITVGKQYVEAFQLLRHSC